MANSGAVLVIGGANMDLRCTSSAAPMLGTSNPGVMRAAPGGVGRNIAENLAMLGTPVRLVAAIGDDPFGGQLLAQLQTTDVGTDLLVRSPGATGLYVAVLDSTGELLVAVADMGLTDALTPESLKHVEAELPKAAAVVLDANLPQAVLRWAMARLVKTKVPVVIDPVSVAKASKIRTLLTEFGDAGTPIAVTALTPNLHELEGLVGVGIRNTPTAIAAACDQLHELGVRKVWVRRGNQPSFLSNAKREATNRFLIEAPKVGKTLDVTGAGDAMTAAFVHRLLKGGSAREAARFAQCVGAATVAVHETVHPTLRDALSDIALPRVRRWSDRGDEASDPVAVQA